MLPGYEVAAVVAGPAVYLIGHFLFSLKMTGTLSRKRLFGALACLATEIVGVFLPALVLAGLLIAVLVAVLGFEHVAAARREPSPLERLEAPAARHGQGS